MTPAELAADLRAHPRIVEQNWDDAAERLFITRGGDLHGRPWDQLRLTMYGDSLRTEARNLAVAEMLEQLTAAER